MATAPVPKETSNKSARTNTDSSRPLTGPERAAVLMLALGDQHGGKDEEGKHIGEESPVVNCAFADLQRENLGIPQPDTFCMIFRYTHPSIAERITFCNTYRPWDETKPPRDADRFKP